MKSLFAAVLLLVACAREPRVDAGSAVTLEYELSSGGSVLESSAGRGPLAVVLGRGDLPAAVEAALIGAKVGEEKVVALTPPQGFGLADPANIRTLPIEKFGAMAKDLGPGAVVGGASGGKAAEGKVVKIEDGAVTLDFNHPLAGKALTYKLKVLSIRAP